MLHIRCYFWVPGVGRNQKEKIAEESEWLHNPCLLRVTKMGRNQNGYITVRSPGPETGGLKMAA